MNKANQAYADLNVESQKLLTVEVQQTTLTQLKRELINRRTIKKGEEVTPAAHIDENSRQMCCRVGLMKTCERLNVDGCGTQEDQ